MVEFEYSQKILMERKPKMVVSAPGGLEGEGFPVRRAFAGLRRGDLDPFIHMDQMGEVNYAPYEPKGTTWHPHRGFETVTYMLEGEFQHQDSHGGGGLLRPGDTQWMTAGSGILHIETPPEHLVISGGVFHGVQLWVNLPAKSKWSPPRYQHISGTSTHNFYDNGDYTIKVLAGSIDIGEGPETHKIDGSGVTHTPINLFHVIMMPDTEMIIPWPENFNAITYVLSGEGLIPSQKLDLKVGTTVVFEKKGQFLHFRADKNKGSETKKLSMLLMGGEPIREPIVQHGPFVMNTKEQIQQALRDYQSGKMGTVPDGGITPYRR